MTAPCGVPSSVSISRPSSSTPAVSHLAINRMIR
jgi:hypothetical protein